MYAIIMMLYRLQIGPVVVIVVVSLENVVVASSWFLLVVVVRRVVVVAGEVLGFIKSNFSLLLPPILLDGEREEVAVSPVDLSWSGGMIVVVVLLVELRVVVERLVRVNVVLLVVERLVGSVSVDIIVDVVVGFDVDVGRRLVGVLVVVTI